MAQSHFPFWDTALLGTSVVTHTLFSQPEGSAADKQSEDTNMRIGGQFAQGSTFTIHRVAGFVDDNLALADVPLVWEQSVLRMLINNKIKFEVPLAMVSAFGVYGGHYSETTASDVELIGRGGNGWDLRIPILVRGGEQIKVELDQGTALNNASQRFKVILDGILNDND